MRDWKTCPYRESQEAVSRCAYTSERLGWSHAAHYSCCLKCAGAGDLNDENAYLRSLLGTLNAARVRRGDGAHYLGVFNGVPARTAFKRYVAIRGKRVAAWLLDDINEKAQLSPEECADLAERENISDDDFAHKETPRAPRIPQT